jgi:hypothetical protein
MNLQSQITEIRRRIAEPYSTDASDQNITDDEIVDWIRQAEIKLLYDISVETISTIMTPWIINAAIAGTGIDYVVLPTVTMFRPVSITLLRTAGASQVPCRVVPFTDWLRSKNDPNWRVNHLNPIAAISDGNIYTNPVATSASTVRLRYLAEPDYRYRHFVGSVTSKTSNTVWADTKAVAKGWPDDYFNPYGTLTTQVKYTSGEPNGNHANVTDYTGATGTFTLSVSASYPISNESFRPDVNVGDTYEVGQVGTLPAQFDRMIYSYVEYLCWCKGNDDAAAQRSMNQYMTQIDAINGRVLDFQGGRS